MFEQYNDIMTIADVAEALYIGKNRVYELLEKDAIKGFRIGKIWKIPKAALQEYVLLQSHMSN